MGAHTASVVNQTLQVFVYEESADPINAGNNGTLKLIRSLPEGELVSSL